MIDIYPMLMKPNYKSYLWGGNRLKKYYGKNDGPELIAESWELADHKDGFSIVANGTLKGKTISELGALNHNSFWGSKCNDGIFPILVKLIDAKDKLSIQVHPSDYSAITENGEAGKAELWYIVDCDKNSFIYLGLKKRISRKTLEDCIANNTICTLLNKVFVKKGDVFFVSPETIHAIGSNIVLAEIQQNSNTTFRMYDYNRCDNKGNQRELHLNRAIDVVNINATVPSNCKSTGIMNFSDFRMTEMYVGNEFKAYKIDVINSINLLCDGSSFHHLLCIEGEGYLLYNGSRFVIKKGDSYFVPAGLGQYELFGQCKIILSRL